MKTEKNIKQTGKIAVITFRCTSEMGQKIKNKSNRLGLNVSAFTLNCVEAGLDRKTKYDKKRVKEMVEVQESLNQLVSSMNPEQEESIKKLLDISKEMMKLWEF